MQKVLVVEDSKFFATLIKNKIEDELGFSAVVVETKKAAKLVLDVRKDDFFIALLDLNLPDADEYQIVDLVSSYKLPSVVFSGSYSEGVLSRSSHNYVLDYVIKDNPSSVDYLLSLVQRFYKNQFVNVLVVDDSDTQRKVAADYLRGFNLNVFEESDGAQALRHLERKSKGKGELKKDRIQLLVTDYEMPGMDGFELVLRARKKFNKEQLGIIGFSALEDRSLAAKFLKFGADDFIIKPLQPEEFLSRVSHNLNNIDQLRNLRQSATRDYLTGLFNRRYFFKETMSKFEKAKKEGQSCLIAMLDIDHFKVINDTYGHGAGDEVLVKVAQVLEENSQENDIVARFGGEEFCIFARGLHPDIVGNYLNHLRVKISEIPFISGEKKFSVTTSIGATMMVNDALDEMIQSADSLLYDAKKSGRNRVLFDI